MRKYLVVKNDTSGMYDVLETHATAEMLLDEHRDYYTYKHANERARSLNAALLVRQAVQLLEGLPLSLELPARREFAKLN